MPIATATPILDLASKTILLYGTQKIGKSTFASQFPGAVFIATERGLDNLTVTRWEHEDGHYVVGSWEELYEATREVIALADTKTVIIDIVDHAYTLCEWAVCQKYSVDYKNDGQLGYGKGGSMIDNAFKKYIKQLTAKGLGVLLVSHARTMEIDGGMRIVPTIPDRARALILGEVDMILYATTETAMQDNQKVTTRVLKTKPNPAYEAGDRTGRLPETLPLDFQAFLRAFEGC